MRGFFMVKLKSKSFSLNISIKMGIKEKLEIFCGSAQSGDKLNIK